MFRATVVASVIMASSPAFSDPACDSLLASRALGSEPALYALMVRHTRSGVQPSPLWVAMRDNQVVELWPGLTFAVAARRRSTPQELVLKTSWAQGGGGETPAVRIVRASVASPCTKLFGLLWWAKPAVDTNVTIADYILYHQLADKTNPDIVQFHVRYPDDAGGCIATDDIANGNIEQFVSGDEAHRKQVRGALLAQVKANLTAWADEAHAASAQSDAILTPLLSNYRGFANLETRIIARPSGEDLCEIVDTALPERSARGVFALDILKEGDKTARHSELVWRIRLN